MPARDRAIFGFCRPSDDGRDVDENSLGTFVARFTTHDQKRYRQFFIFSRFFCLRYAPTIGMYTYGHRFVWIDFESPAKKTLSIKAKRLSSSVPSPLRVISIYLGDCFLVYYTPTYMCVEFTVFVKGEKTRTKGIKRRSNFLNRGDRVPFTYVRAK